jgi:tetratricopeptide (TPR) repeat protein
MPRAAKLSRMSLQETNRDVVTFLILFLLAFLPYSNIFFNSFVHDDSFQVVANPYAHSFRYLRQIFTTSVWSFQGAQGVSNYYRPIMTFGYLLTYQIAGLVPFSFHLANIVLNGIVVWLVFLILRRFSGERVALVAAGLFALHPIHTEPVAWIAAVTDLELTLFYLATFLFYLKLPEAKNNSWPRAAMCACYALALLSKEQAMTLPFLVMLFEHFYRDDRSTTTLKEKISRYGALWIIAALYLAVRALVMGGFAAVLMRPNLSWYQTGLSAVALIGGYLGKLIWPARLSAFYVFHASQHFTDAQFLAGLAGLVLCAILFAALWRRAHIVSFAILWVLLPLGPVLNARWMPAGVFGERYLYLPSFGFCWLVAWGAVQLWNGSVPAIPRLVTRTVPPLLCAIALIYGVKTVSRNRDWRDEEILYRRVIESQGDTSLIRSNLGTIAFNRGDSELAEREWLDALAIGPSNGHALDSMAYLRQMQHRYFEAVDYSWRALRIRPEDTFGRVTFAETLAAMGRPAEADWQFRVAIALSPLSTSAHNSYGKFLLAQGRSEDARAEYERSVDADFNTDAYDQLGDIYLAWQDFPRAEKAFRHALTGNAFDSQAHFGLGRALEFTSRPAEALREYESGLAMDPSDAVAKAAANRLRVSAASQTGAH